MARTAGFDRLARERKAEVAAKYRHRLHMEEHGSEWTIEMWDDLSDTAKNIYRKMKP